MPYLICPVCKDPEKTIRMELEGSYEPDTGAGPSPVVYDVECGCFLTADQLEQLEAAALSIDMHEWEPSEP